MRFKSTGQCINAIDSGTFKLITAFHDYLKLREHVIDDDFKYYFPYLTLCEHTCDLDIAPKIIYSASLSGTRQVFGNAWAESPSSNDTTPDIKLERLAAPGYQEAAADRYTCDIVETIIRTNECDIHIEFLRYIAEIETGSGIKFFALAGKILNRTLQ